jgi:hypothetical protein
MWLLRSVPLATAAGLCGLLLLLPLLLELDGSWCVVEG